MERIIDITERGLRLAIDCGCFTIARGGEEVARIPLDDIATLLLSESAVSMTGAVLAGLAKRGAIVISCDSRYLPVGMMQPMITCHKQTGVLAAQIRAGKVVKKRLWQALVKQKICQQAVILETQALPAADLKAITLRVSSGDPLNLEGYAARIYWQRLALFPIRDRNADDANRLFNYAYAVVFAATARALCAVGLHPGLGIRHHNQYNPFCLASDLMEPFRGIADHAVISWLNKNRGSTTITVEAKRFILNGLLSSKVRFKSRWETIFPALTRAAVSLRNCLTDNHHNLLLPNVSPDVLRKPMMSLEMLWNCSGENFFTANRNL